MTQEEIKQYLKDNLRIYADLEDGFRTGNKRIVISLSLGGEVISDTKLFI